MWPTLPSDPWSAPASGGEPPPLHVPPPPPALPPPPPPAPPTAVAAPVRHAAPTAHPVIETPRIFVAAMYALVLAAVGIVAWAFAQAPVVPGVDPGHWLAISYTYVGLPTAPDPTDRVLFYPPLLFPFLGSAAVLLGPLDGVMFVALALFALFGFSLVYLARRFLIDPSLQLLLVGLSVLSGPTLQMLFWGGYPNLLGFLLFDLAMVALLKFVRSAQDRDGALLYLVLGLAFLAHDLTFTLLMATLAVCGVFLLLFRKMRPAFLLRPVNLLGFAALGGLVEGYSLLTRSLGITHPNYYSSNPTAYAIDQLGFLFTPLSRAPILPPFGAAVLFPSGPLALVLVAAPVVAMAGLYVARRLRPERVDTRVVVAAGWFVTVVAIPGAGWLAHVDTDYARFLYFIPLPFFLLLFLAVERAALPSVLAAAQAASPAPPRPPSPAGAPPTPRRPSRPALWAQAAPPLSILIVVLVALLVTIPVVRNNEASATAIAHDPPFLSAMAWLKHAPDPGAVLTPASAARWTEALSDHDAYTVGPIWLLFDPFQIADAQQTYWALTSQAMTTNDHVALAVSGFRSTLISQAPMYTAYVEGVPFPVFRLLPGSLSVNASGPNGTVSYPLAHPGTPTVALGVPTPTSIEIRYANAVATVIEDCSTLDDGGAQIQFHVTPSNGSTIHSWTFALVTPPSDSPTLATDQPGTIAYSGGRLDWPVGGFIGQDPNRIVVATAATFDPVPASVIRGGIGGPNAVGITLAMPAGASSFTETIRASSAGASNPPNALPPLFSTVQFLDDHGIRYLLWPAQGSGATQLAYLEATFGFAPVFVNSEWRILERPG